MLAGMAADAMLTSRANVSTVRPSVMPIGSPIAQNTSHTSSAIRK